MGLSWAVGGFLVVVVWFRIVVDFRGRDVVFSWGGFFEFGGFEGRRSLREGRGDLVLDFIYCGFVVFCLWRCWFFFLFCYIVSCDFVFVFRRGWVLIL